VSLSVLEHQQGRGPAISCQEFLLVFLLVSSLDCSQEIQPTRDFVCLPLGPPLCHSILVAIIPIRSTGEPGD